MAGNLAGACRGAATLERESPAWWHDLEYRDDLIQLSDGLFEGARPDGHWTAAN